MKVLVVGAGGVGAAFAAIAQRRPVFEHVVLADVAIERAQAAADRLGEPDRFSAERVDASSREDLVDLIGRVKPDAVLNACDPRFNEPIFAAAFDAKVTYLDMAMTLSHPHPERPYELPGEMLGDKQLAMHEAVGGAGVLALVGIGVEPGLSDIFARYAADELFSSITEVGVRDGADLVVEGYDFAPTFSIWTTIEECLNPPLIWERERGFYTTAPFSEPEIFNFPEGIGPVECVNVEHEEVVLIPAGSSVERVTFKYGLGQEFIDVLSTLHKLGPGLDRARHGPGEAGLPARRRRRGAARPGDARRADERADLRRHVGHGHGQGRQPALDLPLPRGRQREDHARVRKPGGRLADRHQPRRRARAARPRRLEGHRRAGSRGLPAGPFLELLGEYGSPTARWSLTSPEEARSGRRSVLQEGAGLAPEGVPPGAEASCRLEVDLRRHRLQRVVQ